MIIEVLSACYIDGIFHWLNRLCNSDFGFSYYSALLVRTWFIWAISSIIFVCSTSIPLLEVYYTHWQKVLHALMVVVSLMHLLLNFFLSWFVLYLFSTKEDLSSIISCFIKWNGANKWWMKPLMLFRKWNTFAAHLELLVAHSDPYLQTSSCNLSVTLFLNKVP